jgi:hypothetical protein
VVPLIVRIAKPELDRLDIVQVERRRVSGSGRSICIGPRLNRTLRIGMMAIDPVPSARVCQNLIRFRGDEALFDCEIDLAGASSISSEGSVAGFG